MQCFFNCNNDHEIDLCIFFSSKQLNKTNVKVDKKVYFIFVLTISRVLHIYAAPAGEINPGQFSN